MSFFDDKQEILNIELTTYGRYLISRGKFKPEYYAFFDDDVLYDAEYANISESQNNIQTRILDETPSLKPQTTFTSIENAVKLSSLLQEEIGMLKIEEEQRNPDKNYVLSMPLANCSHNTNYAPSWALQFLKGNISSSSQYIDNTENNLDILQPFIRYPQINLKNNEYNIKRYETNLVNESGYAVIEVFTDNQTRKQYFYTMKEEPIILELTENNVDDLLKNFDIEVFVEEQKQIPGKTETITALKQLNFKKQTIEIENGILLDEPKTFDIEENQDFVEYFFELTVDDEIDLPPQQKAQTSAPYAGPVTKPPFGADC